jgi:hypothetical protein
LLKGQLKALLRAIDNAERMKDGSSLPRASSHEDNVRDTTEELETRISDLFYTKLPEADSNPPPASVVDEQLSLLLIDGIKSVA